MERGSRVLGGSGGKVEELVDEGRNGSEKEIVGKVLGSVVGIGKGGVVFVESGKGWGNVDVGKEIERGMGFEKGCS